MKPKAEQVAETILYDPGLPLWLLTAVCGAIGLLLVFFFCRERKKATRPAVVPLLFVFRLLAIAGVWLALANPTALRKTRRTIGKHAAVYLDASASMSIQDKGKGRANAARWRAAINEVPTRFNSLDETSALLSTTSIHLSQASMSVGSGDLERHLELARSSSREAFARIDEAFKMPEMKARVAHLRDQLKSEILDPVERLRQLSAPEAGSRDSVRGSLDALGRRARELRSEVHSIVDGLPSNEDEIANATERTRMVYAQEWLTKSEWNWLGGLDGKCELIRSQFAQATTPIEGGWDSVRAADLNDTAAATDLRAALNELGRRASSNQLDLAILVTDGVHTTAGQPLVIPESLARTPLLVVPFGDFEPQRDLDLRSVEAPQRILVKDHLTVRARVSGSLADGEVTSVELINGQQVLDSKEVRFAGQHSEQLVELSWQPSRVQTCELIVRVKPIATEASLANNERTVTVSVVDDNLSVLVVDSVPRWETRYLFSIFQRETQTKSTTLLFNPVHGYAGRSPPPQPALPLAIEAWQQFQVVILGDLNPLQLTPEHQRVLRSFVEKGGHLIVIGGGESMPEAFAGGSFTDMLPVVKDPSAIPASGFGVKLSSEGLISDVLRLTDNGRDANAALWTSIFNALPIYDLSKWSKPKPSARVLIEAVAKVGQRDAPRSFLATHSYGDGSVTFLSSPSTHSLRWRTGDRYHYRFWGQLVRALVAKEFASGVPGIRIYTDKSTYLPGEPVRVSLRLRSDKGAPLKDMSGQIAAYQLDSLVGRAELQPSSGGAGEYEVALQGLPEGVIKLVPEGGKLSPLLKTLKAEAPHASISIKQGISSLETLPLSEPPPFFGMVERSPYGMVVAPTAVPTVLKHFDFDPAVSEVTRRRPLWNEWWLLGAIIGCLSIEWIGRKIAGLV